MVVINDNNKQHILIVDDSEMNRAILSDMLGENYDILEAEDGEQAVIELQKRMQDISLMLLDINMPKMDGFEVLRIMNDNQWIEDIPVIMITAEKDSATIERAYKLGATDFVIRPFDEMMVRHRVANTLMLYSKQKHLINLVADQIHENERHDAMMIDILSHVVEFRNGESGLHIHHVRFLTELLLDELLKITDKYQITPSDIALITTASALHDIGKISIDDSILNKPGKLTDEEFAIMKTHTTVGSEMLRGVQAYKDEPLMKVAYEICRWHHERYDGRGYPDGLKGDDIPISAQIVALADVYDALTSERVYKKAIPHETAVQMILDGRCGEFNPLLMQCLREISGTLEQTIKNGELTREQMEQHKLRSLTREKIAVSDAHISERSLRLFELERTKNEFFSALTQEIQFEYSISPKMIKVSEWGAKRLGIDEYIMNPGKNEALIELFGKETLRKLCHSLHSTTPENPIIRFECALHYGGQSRWHRIVAQALWTADIPHKYTGAIGKAMDIHDYQMKQEELQKRASRDSLTGLLNHSSAKHLIEERIELEPDAKYALVIFDLDHFKHANDNFGHSFGDEILKHLAEKLRNSIRTGDIISRVGGDEFLIFLQYKAELAPIIKRIYGTLVGNYQHFPLAFSMGVAESEKVGTDYQALFNAADKAMYFAKRSGRGRYCFYDDGMKDVLSMISPIDSETDERKGDKQ